MFLFASDCALFLLVRVFLRLCLRILFVSPVYFVSLLPLFKVTVLRK